MQQRPLDPQTARSDFSGGTSVLRSAPLNPVLAGIYAEVDRERPAHEGVLRSTSVRLGGARSEPHEPPFWRAHHLIWSYTFKPAAERAGMSGLHFHELRHTFATLALESGALDMHELSRAMGHASYVIIDKVHAHLRKKDYTAHRARFSAHVAAGSAPPAQPVQLRAARG